MSLIVVLLPAGPAWSGGAHGDHAVPQLAAGAMTTVAYQGNTVTLTVGPVRRTVPDVNPDGSFRSFPPRQIYQSTQSTEGFEVNAEDEHEMVRVHHRPLQDPHANHGMGDYLLYPTAGVCGNDGRRAP